MAASSVIFERGPTRAFWTAWAATLIFFAGFYTLLVIAGLTTLIGSLGLLRLRDFFQRMHGPAMTSTVGLAPVTRSQLTKGHSSLRSMMSLAPRICMM